MLSLVGGQNRDCNGIHRRQFMQIGSLAGVSLPMLLAHQAQASEKNHLTGKSIVFLFLQGGPSHIEMFDPKMSAPVEFRSVTGEVKTKTAGLTLGGTFPNMAQQVDRFTLVRSFASRNSGHTYFSVSGANNPLKATMGAIYSRVAGTNNPLTGMPSNTIVVPEAIKPKLRFRTNFETNALPTLTTAGELGASYASFNPSGGGQLKSNMQLKVSEDRLTDRRALLQNLDKIKRQVDADGLLDGSDRFQQQAFDVITRGVADAFDLSKEDPRTVERYDTSKLFDMKKLNRFNDMYRSSNLLGHQMLLARRLCEAGCGFVTVADAGWDMHGNRNSLPRLTGMDPLGRQVDHAVSAFLDDVRQRGLSDKILLVVTGEMGRTPRINKRGGRDHYGGLTSLILAGGGLDMGQVIGRSDKHATRPATTPYYPKHLFGTIMRTMFDVGELRVTRGLPRDLLRVVEQSRPIPGLL